MAAPRNYNNLPLLAGNLPAIHDDCCCGNECTTCSGGSWNSWGTARVTFAGSISNEDCTDCADWLATFDLSDKDGGTCTVKLESGLVCPSTATFGATKLELKFGSGYATLVLYYECAGSSGTWTWTEYYSPGDRDCSASISFSSTPALSTTCASYDMCDFTSVTATVTFI